MDYNKESDKERIKIKVDLGITDDWSLVYDPLKRTWVKINQYIIDN